MTRLVDRLEDTALNDVQTLGLITLLPEHLALHKVDEPEVGRDQEPELFAEVGEWRKGLEEKRQGRRQAWGRIRRGQIVVTRGRRKVMGRVRDDCVVACLR